MSVKGISSDALSVLTHSTVFNSLSLEALRAIAERFRAIDIPAGMVLCEEGQPGDEMYIIEVGQFVVETMLGGKRKRLAELGPGALLGEMALLSGQLRSATVTATTSGRIWGLSLRDFQELVRFYPELGTSIKRIQAERLRANSGLQPANEKQPLLSFRGDKDIATIGRASTNDIVLHDPQVSRVHALIQRVGDQFQVVDLNSTNGTYVNGERVWTRVLKEGDEIWIGANPILFDRSGVARFSRGAGVQVDAIGLTKVVKGSTTILHDVSLSIYPGEFVCIVGGSGAGKTTLLNALSGLRPATQGYVVYNGVNYYEHFDVYRQTLGYVPQDDIVHMELSVYQTLYYAARLRLPKDTERGEIKQNIDKVLENLELTQRRNTEVRNLSGGQRKRVSIGVELLTEPSIFYLDEPTSGLDPGLDGRMMDLFRKLANQGRTVILTTHATKNIMICDKVAFMVRGGYLAFFGAPSDALTYFGVSDFTDIYKLLEFESTPEDWAQKFRQSKYFQCNVQQRLGGSPSPAASKLDRAGLKRTRSSPMTWVRQFWWLSQRYVSILLRDPVALGLLLLAAPIIAFVSTMTFSKKVFDEVPKAANATDGGDARQALFLLFILTAISIYLGAFNASRAISDEIAIYSRERLVNLKIIPYVLSKVGVLGIFALLQAIALIVIVSLRIDLPGNHLPQLGATLALTNLAGIGMGLLVSSVSGNSLRAMLIAVNLLIPQLVLAGASVPLEQMDTGAKVVSTVMISRWALSLLGYYTDINTRLNKLFKLAGMSNDYSRQFDIDPQRYAVILGGLFLVFVVGAMVGLKRRDVH